LTPVRNSAVIDRGYNVAWGAAPGPGFRGHRMRLQRHTL